MRNCEHVDLVGCVQKFYFSQIFDFYVLDKNRIDP